ncbi:PLP-dependent aminotransferase family protein [Dactylosporangium roseum]|nr:PLP-dependent aminotransferase family protein [Dactylosporangium roseum]
MTTPARSTTTAPAALLQTQLDLARDHDDRDTPMYQRIADSIADSIAAGHLSAGDRLPTHRALATHLHVAVPTVSRAYREAEQRGLITSTTGRGTFVGGLPALRQPQADTATIPTHVDLSVNAPARGDHEHHLRAALRRAADDPSLPNLLGYEADIGQTADRQAAAAWLAHSRLQLDPNQIVICHGGQHAILLALSTLLKPGDLLLTEELTYPGLKTAAQMLGLRLRGVAMDEDGIDPAALDEACASTTTPQIRPAALYLMPTAHNPTAITLPEQRRREIARIARHHDLHLIEDDVFGLLAPAEQRPTPLAALAPERTLHLTSLSKTLAPGLRWGAVAAPAHLTDRLGALVRASVFNPAPVAIDIARRWLTDGTAGQMLDWQRQEMRRRFAAAHQRLGTCAAVRAVRTAGLHAWLRLHDPWTPTEVIATAAKLDIQIGPTSFFHVDATNAPSELARGVRLCLGNARDLPTLANALDALATALNRGPTFSTGVRV